MRDLGKIDKSESSRVTSMRIPHDVALFNASKLFKKFSELFILAPRRNSSDKQVVSWVGCGLVFSVKWWWRGTSVIYR